MNHEIDEAWQALCGTLNYCGRALQEEVRTYPTPIARCDEQLTKAIEQRDAAFRHLRRANELARMRPPSTRDEWLRLLHDFTVGLRDVDDESVAAARGRVLAALEQ